MKPVQQVFGLVLDDIQEFKSYSKTFHRKCKDIWKLYDEEKAFEKETKERDKMVEKLIFADSLVSAKNKKNNQKSIMSYFG